MHQKDILIIKVGSSTLTKTLDSGVTVLDIDSFARIGRQIHTLKQEGHHIILVSSAAIAAGMAHTGVSTRPNKITEMPELQRLASIGWRHILNTWSDALPGYTIGELLITKQELKKREETNELTHVIASLLRYGDICIVNENDAITHSEIAFGDNDTLAAHLAAKVNESPLFTERVKLVILSDIHGVYRDKDDESSIIPTIGDIPAYRHIAGAAGSAQGTGGMQTKFDAATIAISAGVEVWIGNGRADNTVASILRGTSGTHFTLPS